MSLDVSKAIVLSRPQCPIECITGLGLDLLHDSILDAETCIRRVLYRDDQGSARDVDARARFCSARRFRTARSLSFLVRAAASVNASLA